MATPNADRGEPYALPLGPKGLCFDKNQFLGNNFSVDVFLHNHRNAASLETMRDDLGVYLKVLRSAMIELINRDYADFVNLSANLIGLDKEIDNIQSPLGQLKEEVLQVRECLADAMKELSGRLEQRRLLREKKKSLQYLSQTQFSLRKLSKILYLSNEPKENIIQELIERASSEYNQLQFTITKCGKFISAEQKNQSEKIGIILISTLENMFLENLKLKKIDKTQRCLQLFSMLDRISDVENLVRKKIVAPEMFEIISESALQKNPNNLKGVFLNILLFIERKLKDLITITKNNKTPVKGYNFLLNSLWPEVEYKLEVHMSSIFAPGNPELFYSRYNESIEFLHKIQEYFSSKKDIEEFYNHPQYKNFQQKWNLPIYFQIRFQEIAGAFETILLDPVNNSIFTTELSSSDYKLKITKACWTSLTTCFAQGIFILELIHRFWKLSIQIISRYCTWIDDVIKEASSPSSSPSNTNNTVADSSNIEKVNADKLKFYIYMYTDVKKLVENFPTFLEIIKTRVHCQKHMDILERCLVDSKALLLSKLPLIQKTVVQQISSDCIIHLKHINDIPRLFRKTNRDIPTKPCGYVAVLTKAPLDFHKLYKNIIGDISIIEWLEGIFSIVTTQYYIAINDVLTSIQKTEDSLRRLKQIRDRPSQTNLEKVGISDDDKIRIQLHVDVKNYCQCITDTNVHKDKVDKLNSLLSLIEKATNNKSNALIQ